MIDHWTTDEVISRRRKLGRDGVRVGGLGVEVTRQDSSRLALARQLPSDPFSIYRRDHLARWWRHLHSNGLSHTS
jgi:hypothetical protein